MTDSKWDPPHREAPVPDIITEAMEMKWCRMPLTTGWMDPGD